jgi:hypothetical protein
MANYDEQTYSRNRFIHETAKQDGSFPLKLRITFERKQVYYGIGISCTESDWQKINKSV